MPRKVIRYEHLTLATSNAAQTADRILEHGWALSKYPTVYLDREIPWALPDLSVRSWNFHVHSWDMVDAVLAAHADTGDTRYLLPAIRVGMSWASLHPTLDAPDQSPFAWYDMAVGVRAYRLAYILDAGTACDSLTPDVQALLARTLEQHRVYLANDENIAFHNNHGFFQVAGQLAMARRFSDRAPGMKEAHQQGIARLKRLMTSQFCSDGVHREHSPDYHRMVYATLKKLIDCDLVGDSEILSFADTIEEALSWFVKPNLHIANFGDSDNRNFVDMSKSAPDAWRTERMRSVVSGNAFLQEAESIRAFSEGGYFVSRRAQGATYEYQSYVAQIAAFHSLTHKHADDLSFIWSDRGADILVDAGRYGYIGKTTPDSPLWKDGHWYSDPVRIYCESTRAHNTLEFDGRNLPRRGTKKYGSALKRWGAMEDGTVFVETECKVFGSIRFVRLLVFQPSQWLITLDWFHDNLPNTHNVRQWFHFAPEVELSRSSYGYSAHLPSSNEPLHVLPLLAGCTLSRLHRGEESPLQGWWSPKEREILPNDAMCFEISGSRTGVFATLFTFTHHLKSEFDWSSANTTGRKVKLKWADDCGQHSLSIHRPKDGPVTIQHACK